MPGATPEDELDEELPPLDDEGDGLDETDDGAPSDLDDELDVLPEGDGNLLDDSTGEGDPLTAEYLDVLSTEPSGSDDAEPNDVLDVGDDIPDLGELGGGWLEAGATDLPEVPEEDPELEEGESMSADGGEEGPLEEGEGVNEEDLPSLDADDGGEGEDAHFFDALTSDEPPLPWSTQRWDPTPVVQHLDVGAVVGLAPASRGAVCMGEQRLFRVELDGVVVPLAAEGLPEGPRLRSADLPRTIFSDKGAIFVVGNQGVYRSDDGGASFAATDVSPDLEESALTRAERTLALPRGFVLAAADTRERDGATLVVVRALSQGRLFVIEIAPSASPPAAIVAELSEPEVEDTDTVGPAFDGLCAAWDEARGLFWIGGPFGVLALQLGSPHTAFGGALAG